MQGMAQHKDTPALPGPEKLEPAQRELLDKSVLIPVRVTFSVRVTGRPFSTLSNPRPLRITSPLVLETTIGGKVVARQILEPADPSYNLEKRQINTL